MSSLRMHVNIMCVCMPCVYLATPSLTLVGPLREWKQLCTKSAVVRCVPYFLWKAWRLTSDLHVHTNMHLCVHTHIHVHTNMHLCTHSHTKTCTHTQTRTCTFAHTHAHTYTHTLQHTCTLVHPVTYGHAHAHTYTHTHTHTIPNTHTHTHTHTHTRTHTLATQLLVPPFDKLQLLHCMPTFRYYLTTCWWAPVTPVTNIPTATCSTGCDWVDGWMTGGSHWVQVEEAYCNVTVHCFLLPVSNRFVMATHTLFTYVVLEYIWNHTCG